MEYSPGLRHPLPVARRRRHDRAVRELGVEVVSSGDLVQRFEAALGRATRSRRTGRRPRRLYRIKDRAFDFVRRRAGRRPPHDRVRHPAGDGAGWFERRGAREPTRPERVGPGERRQPALPADRRRAPPHRPRTRCVLLDLWGKRADAGRGLRRHHVGGLHRRRACRRGRPRVRRAAAARATRPSRSSRTASRAGAGRPRLRGRRGRAPRARSAPATATDILHRTGPQPRRRGPRQRRPHGRLRDARRPAAVPGHGLHHRAGRSISTTFGVRTEINMYVDVQRRAPSRAGAGADRDARP